MKTSKIFLLALLAFADVDCFSQNYGDYGDDEYLERICFPSAFSTCRSISLSGDLDANAYLSPNANALFRPIMSAGDTVTDIEQFYPCDSTARLSGVAFLGMFGFDSDTLMSLRLRDVVSDSVITEVYKPVFHRAYQREDERISIVEYLFDDVITVNRDFSLSLWFPEEFYVRDANSHYSWYVNGISYAYYTRNSQTGEVTPCHSNKTPMVRYTDGTTKPFLQMAQEAGQVAYAEQLHVERGWYCDIFYFPIFAEPGTEDEGGNSAVVDVNLESYTSLYPNPASKSVNVVCSYKIKGYTLVDATGREVLSGKCNANSMALDVSSLQKGVYFIRLQTAKGSVEKKLLVE